MLRRATTVPVKVGQSTFAFWSSSKDQKVIPILDDGLMASEGGLKVHGIKLFYL